MILRGAVQPVYDLTKHEHMVYLHNAYTESSMSGRRKQEVGASVGHDWWCQKDDTAPWWLL